MINFNTASKFINYNNTNNDLTFSDSCALETLVLLSVWSLLLKLLESIIFRYVHIFNTFWLQTTTSFWYFFHCSKTYT